VHRIGNFTKYPSTHQEVSMNTTLKFTFEKETKGAVRYQESGN
jgi:hypothetical protein